ncbi:MAG: hypothetical protein IJP74_10335 [Prevotella sp.]|nr:hypothetical protein [Prevotella sp.]
MAKKESKLNAKQKAYAKKQEKEGANIVMWIIGLLVLLGIAYTVWSSWVVS